MSRNQRFADLHFDTPCCYLQATDDRLVPRQAAEQFIERFELCHVERVEGPHLLLPSKPVECATIIAEQYRRFTGHADDG